MNAADEQIMGKIAAFEKEQDPTLLYQALDWIEAAERDLSPGDATARKHAVSRRLRFLTALNRHIDPKWYIEDKPAQGVPPPSPHCVVYPSGEVDPSTIPDPTMRTEYERALKANKARRKWYDVQFQLRRIDERAMSFLELFVAERYADVSEDYEELSQLLAESPLNDAHEKRLRALIKKL